jgi:hypothetical protein
MALTAVTSDRRGKEAQQHCHQVLLNTEEIQVPKFMFRCSQLYSCGVVNTLHCLSTALWSGAILSEKYQQPSVRPSVSPVALTQNYIPDFGHVLGSFYASSVTCSGADSAL